MTDFAYVQDFVYDTSGSVINNSIRGGTVVDGDNDDQFETGDQIFGVHNYAGTMTVSGIVMPVFLRSDGNHHVYNPGPGFVTPPAAFPGATSGPFAFCFAKGSLIATPDGEIAVEDLAIGDMVRSASGRAVPVKWVGRQTIRKLFHGPHMQPVRIRAGALGGGLPHSDLVVTADHGMVINELVVNASALVNGDTIDFVPLAELEDSFTVYHIETEAHDVILANGAASETFIDAAGRAAFNNYQEYLDLYGAERIIPEMNRPRISSRRLLPQAIKDHLRPGETDATTRAA